MPKRKSLYSKYPDYKVELHPNPRTVRARFNGKVVAESGKTLLVRETKHDPVVYFPREDVRFDLLERTDHETFCPFKGEASYWSLRVEDQGETNVVWSYEEPFDEVSGLRYYVAFYPDHVELTEEP